MASRFIPTLYVGVELSGPIPEESPQLSPEACLRSPSNRTGLPNQSEKRYIWVNDVVEQALNLRTYGLQVNNIELEMYLQPDLPRTVGDANQLQQVFLNLIMNAEQEMSKVHGHGELRVTTNQIAGEIKIAFTDDGPGSVRKTSPGFLTHSSRLKSLGREPGLV